MLSVTEFFPLVLDQIVAFWISWVVVVVKKHSFLATLRQGCRKLQSENYKSVHAWLAQALVILDPRTKGETERSVMEGL
jgi:hypothetical protein